jgi:predicted MFS family arabinose efflux permease
MITTYRAVLAERQFRRLLGGVAASCLGDGLSVVTVAWLALELAAPGRGALAVGAALAAYTLPAAVGAVAFARWLRGVPANRLVIASATLRAVCLGAAAALHWLGWLHAVEYVVLLGVSALLAAWGSAGTYALVSLLVDADRRLAANSLVTTCILASTVVGPAVAAGLVVAIGAAAALAVDALTFLVLAVQAARIRVDPAPLDGPAVSSGLRLLRGHPHLVGLIAVTALFYFAYGPVEVALPVFVAEDLGRSAGLLAVYWTGFGVGALVGGLLGGVLRRPAMWRFVAAVVIGWGLVLVPFGLTRSVWVTVLCFTLGGVVYGPYPAFTTTLFQSAVTPAELPALLAARGAVTIAATPLGAAAGAPLVAVLGAQETILISGVVTVCLGIVTATIYWNR